MFNLSGATFIRNNQMGYCCFESMWTLLPVLDELVVLDLGSTDGTLETLKEIEAINPKVKVRQGKFPAGKNANEFATLANEVIGMTSNDRVLYWQADEIWHPLLMKLMVEKFKEGNFDLSFWRIQYKENFQRVKWFPHFVHRVGVKGKFHFATENAPNTDGMNSDRYMDATLCSSYGPEYFLQWGDMGEEKIKPYVGEMIMDVSNTGGFFENIVEKRRAHGPFWNEDCVIDGESCASWYAKQRNNPNWLKTESPFNIPPVMHYHLGKVRYQVRPQLIEEIKHR